MRVERVLALTTLDPRLVDRLGIRPDPADVDLGRRLDTWLRLHYGRLPRSPRILPSLYVLMRGPSVGLAGGLALRSGEPAFSGPPPVNYSSWLSGRYTQ